MKKYLFIIPLLLIVFSVYTKKESVKPERKKSLLLVSYNVENLFDTIDAPNKFDNEFTPNSPKKWYTERYFKKINDIALVLSSIDKNRLPDLIGLIEVENKSVLEDLIKSEYLKKMKYKIVHEETTDPRGIDVALLYNPKIFKYISHKQIPIIDSTGKRYNTREILMVKGEISRETVYIFINHWKSRYGGAQKTEYKRILAASILKKSIDEVLEKDYSSKIICLGDFNDTPFDKSLEKTLNVSTDSIFETINELFNLTAYLAKKGQGTNSYRSNWFMIDNIIVTQNMLDKSSKIVADGSTKIFKSPINMYYNSKANDSIPNRTYGGNSYFGGISDHLPVFQYFNIN